MQSFRNFLNEGINDKGIFKAIFMGGTPGAGKSYVIKSVKSGNIEPKIVNVDKFLEFLSVQRNIDISDAGSDPFKALRDESKKLSKKELANFINGALPLFIDGTSAKINNMVQRMGILEFFGYDIGMVWVQTDLDQALERARKRKRDVPEDFIKQVNEVSLKNKEFFKSKFKFFVEVSNNDGELTDKVIKKVFNKVSGFFNKPINNPIGNDFVKRMKEGNQKLLVPEIFDKGEIEKRLSIWFRK